MRLHAPLLSASVLSFVTATNAADVPAAHCNEPAFRQFDFWLGEWQVYTPDGTLAGSNRIEREYDGCVIHERYTTPRAYRGESLNMYDATRRLWHQTWVDNEGTLLILEGGLTDGSMVLEGQAVDTKGVVTKHRITWTPNTNGTVRQHWQSTNDAGQWITAFDGLYRRK